MSFISFKQFKLFKSPEIPPRKKNNSRPPQREEKIPFWKAFLQNPFTSLVVFVLLIAYFLSYLPSKSLPQLEEGDIASMDIVAPMDMTIEDTETTEKRRQEAMDAVLPVYTFDKNVFLNTEEKIRQFFSLGREWLKESQPTPKNIEEFQKNVAEKFGLDVPVKDLTAFARNKFSPDFEETLINLVGTVSSKGVILSKNLFIHREEERGFTLLKAQESERTVRVDEILDLRESREKLAQEITELGLSPRDKALLTSLAHLFISPSITFNKVETDARKERAKMRVETVFFTVKKGRVIIRKGDEATPETLKWIRIINQNLQEKPKWILNFLGTFFLFGLLFVTLWYYLKSILDFHPALRRFIMMGTTLLLSLFIYKISQFLADTVSENTTLPFLANPETYRHAFPFQFGVLLFSFLTTNHITLVFVILNSLLAGYLFFSNYYFMIFSLIGGLAAIYGIKYYHRQKRTSILRAGVFLVAPVNVFVIVTFRLITERLSAFDVFAVEMTLGIIGGIISAAVAFLLLPVFESVFGFVTQARLLELTNSDLPIFRQMALEAPGTYHHSLLVASLAEKAAEELKLDSMLVKAGTLYHDIGKIKRPEYFIENKLRNSDLHRDLTPSMSTLVIVNHVKEGMEMARKLKLPRKIKEIIEQHHGNSLVRYFYQKAKERYNPEMHKIGEESYRYPGPPPKSKEAALILLADSIEAASRSLKSPTRESLKRVIQDIFDNYLQDGQLDNCDFSLREIRAIASSFLSTLDTIYHHRVEYPGFDFEMKKKKKPEKTEKQEKPDKPSQPEEKPDD